MQSKIEALGVGFVRHGADTDNGRSCADERRHALKTIGVVGVRVGDFAAGGDDEEYESRVDFVAEDVYDRALDPDNAVYKESIVQVGRRYFYWRRGIFVRKGFDPKRLRVVVAVVVLADNAS